MDPIVQTVMAFAQAVMENPVASAFVVGLIRNATGYLQKTWKEKTGKDYDPKILGATILKYEVAVNAIIPLLPVEYAGVVAPAVLVADIVFSAAKKLVGK